MISRTDTPGPVQQRSTPRRNRMEDGARVVEEDLTGAKRKRHETDDDAQNALHINYTCIFEMEEDPVPIIPRVHTQLLMQGPGPCIKHFSSLRELVRVTRDCEEDHKKLHSNNVLHRDVSPANMIIVPQDPLWKEPAKGRLVDFDHAKHTTQEMNTAFTREEPISEDAVKLVLSMLQSLTSTKISEHIGHDIIIAALRVFPPHTASLYIRMAIEMREQYFGLAPPDDGVYHCIHLGWNKDDRVIPNFNDHQARLGFRSGTLPYMSYEVLAGATHPIYYGLRDGYYDLPTFFHNAAHDVDSFNWVLIHICLTRKGPGMDMHRDELLPPSNESPETKPLHTLLHDLFHADERKIKETRLALLLPPTKFDDEVVPLFHPYFKLLEPMMKQLWHTMALAYRFRAFEYVHAQDFAIEILERTEAQYEHDASFNDIKDTRKRNDIAMFNGLGNDDTQREIRRQVNHYQRALTVFERPLDALGQSSFTLPEDTESESHPAPKRDPESPGRPQNSRKKARV
ncbi:hypothetical protein Hypma_015861 [Hypsizygus marmoreus]|uniref:Protein kinase domain-containing protein n=1 Tax=Hypsizygus marmoreus TaxID=39966 RepID=A0A369K4C0_HYPMA|nr:hypothetical protein Hypma_015861 [Hypsizygus marmoreus]